MIDLIALALQCNVAPAVTYKSLGVPQGKVYRPNVSMSKILRTIMMYSGVSEEVVAKLGVDKGHLTSELKAMS